MQPHIDTSYRLVVCSIHIAATHIAICSHHDIPNRTSSRHTVLAVSSYHSSAPSRYARPTNLLTSPTHTSSIPAHPISRRSSSCLGNRLASTSAVPQLSGNNNRMLQPSPSVRWSQPGVNPIHDQFRGMSLLRRTAAHTPEYPMIMQDSHGFQHLHHQRGHGRPMIRVFVGQTSVLTMLPSRSGCWHSHTLRCSRSKRQACGKAASLLRLHRWTPRSPLLRWPKISISYGNSWNIIEQKRIWKF